MSGNASTAEDQHVERVGEDIVLSEPTIIRRGKKTWTYTQSELVSIAERLIEVRAAKAQLDTIERRLLRDIDNIMALMNARAPITTFPTTEQRRTIKLYERAAKRGDPETFSMIFDLCCETGAHRTSWRSEHDEPMLVHFSRRIAEMGDGGKGAKS